MMVEWLTMYMVQNPPKYDDVICEQPLRVHGICTLDQLEGWTMYFGQWGLWLACWILHDLIFVLIKFEECSGDVDDNNYQMWEVCSTLTPDHSTSDALYLLLGQTYTTRDPYHQTYIFCLKMKFLAFLECSSFYW